MYEGIEVAKESKEGNQVGFWIDKNVRIYKDSHMYKQIDVAIERVEW